VITCDDHWIACRSRRCGVQGRGCQACDGRRVRDCVGVRVRGRYRCRRNGELGCVYRTTADDSNRVTGRNSGGGVDNSRDIDGSALARGFRSCCSSCAGDCGQIRRRDRASQCRVQCAIDGAAADDGNRVAGRHGYRRVQSGGHIGRLCYASSCRGSLCERIWNGCGNGGYPC
jgi:hypothetical protein